MLHDRCNYFSFWTFFCPFTLDKSKFIKNEKKRLEISSFYICSPKIMIRLKNYDYVQSLTYDARQVEIKIDI